MTQSNLPIGNATSRPVSPQSVLMYHGASSADAAPCEAVSGGAARTDAPLHLRGPQDAALSPALSRDAALELAYGCVDWFIYVTDSVAIGPVTPPACAGD